MNEELIHEWATKAEALSRGRFTEAFDWTIFLEDFMEALQEEA